MEDKNNNVNLQDINKQSRNFFFTINAHAGEEKAITHEVVAGAFEALDPSGQWVFQMEQGDTTGYIHYQATIYMTHARRRKDVFRVLTAHGIMDADIEITRKAEGARRYCSKSETRMDGPWWSSEDFKASVLGKAGKTSDQGKRGDMARLRMAVEAGKTPDDLLLSPSTSGLLASGAVMRYVDRLFIAVNARRWSREQRPDIHVHYVWGPTGAGKTRYVYDHYTPDEIYVAHLGARDPFAGYRFQKVLVLDEFRSQCPISDLLQMLDRYPYEIDRRYEDSWAAWTEVYILSNWTMDRQYEDTPGEDRAAFERRITDFMHFPDPGDSEDEELWEEAA